MRRTTKLMTWTHFYKKWAPTAALVRSSHPCSPFYKLFQTASDQLPVQSQKIKAEEKESQVQNILLSLTLSISQFGRMPSDIIGDFFPDCSALKMVAATTDAIIPALEAMKAESRNVNSYISTTKRDIDQIKWVESCLKEIQKYLFQICTSITTRTSMLKKDSWNIRSF